MSGEEQMLWDGLRDRLDELFERVGNVDQRLTNLEQQLVELNNRPTVFFEPVWCQRCGLEPCQCPVVCEPMHVIPGKPTHVIPGYVPPICGYTAPPCTNLCDCEIYEYCEHCNPEKFI